MSNMLWTEIQQPIYPVEYSNNNNTLDSHKLKHQLKQKTTAHPYIQQRQTSLRKNSISSSKEDIEEQKHASPKSNTKRKHQSNKSNDDDEKRKNFLERNRQAALKCRQRKKQWLNNLQARVEFLSNDNEQLQIQVNLMREEAISLRNLLMAHKDCHLNKAFQQQRQQQQQQIGGIVSTITSNSSYINT